jgi:hypothetical protein
MNQRVLSFSLIVAFATLISLLTGTAQTRRGPAPAPRTGPAQKPAETNLKIKYKSTMGGQAMESTTMIKGPRERSEMNTGYGMDSVNITQCDLKRTIQVSNKNQKYLITPMQTSSSTETTAAPMTQPAQPVRTGGVVTYTTTVTDTGERKEMFGFTARHVKSSVMIESSPDACRPVNQKMETDGWYIDLNVNFDCELGRQQVNAQSMPIGGCRDRTQFRRQGSARLGTPLIVTTTMYGPDGRVMFSSTQEAIELSREPLDAALFDIPAGYTEAKDSQEFYGMPSMDSAMSQANPSSNQTMNTSSIQQSADAKRPGSVRVGVVTFNNKAGKPVSIESLRQRLVSNIESTDVDAVSLNAISPAEAEAEAKAKQCDFILYTDITSLKSSAAKKLGGMFGGAVGLSGAKTEARVDYRLFAVGEGSPRLQSSATAKEEGDEQSAGTAIDAEAQQVSAAVKRG